MGNGEVTDSNIVHPDYIRIIENKTNGWLFKALKPFVTYRTVADINDIKALYGIDSRSLLNFFVLMEENLVSTLPTCAIKSITIVGWKLNQLNQSY